MKDSFNKDNKEKNEQLEELKQGVKSKLKDLKDKVYDDGLELKEKLNETLNYLKNSLNILTWKPKDINVPSVNEDNINMINELLLKLTDINKKEESISMNKTEEELSDGLIYIGDILDTELDTYEDYNQLETDLEIDKTETK